jgi:hypothetical protein
MIFAPRRLLCILLLATCHPVAAEVVRVEITSRTDVGSSGYEKIVGKLHYEIDPRLPANAVIADVGLAPVNASGKVEFSSDLSVLKPKDETRGNGAAWLEIPNRGGQAGLSEWVTEHGFTVVSVGWEFDLPAQPGKLLATVPEARQKDGRPIRGVVRTTFTPDKRVEVQTLTDLEVYPAVDADGPDSRLMVRTRPAFPGGEEVPRHLWTVKDHVITLQGGFEPGKTYEVAWLAEGPPVAGLGYAAIRDAAAWLKRDARTIAPVKHVYAFGASQCGRFLRDFLYLGFNTDEQGRPVLDGVMAHIAGAGRLVLNQRWSQPRSVAGFYTASYPFADTALRDPVSGHEEGILENSRAKHRPKVFYINTAAEYWGAGRVAALTHTDVAGTRDIPFPEGVRSYFFAGTQHGPSPFPPKALVEGAPLANPVSANASIIALRLAMHRWVTEGVPPPPSACPKLEDGSLTPVAGVRFPAVPGMGSPKGVKSGGRLRNPIWEDGAGEHTELPLLVPQVDEDGNDLAGIRLPDVAVPLGTATGWVYRPAAMGAPHELVLLRGAWVPFAATKAGRVRSGDPRPALEERYGSKEVYLARVGEALEDLIRRGFLSNKDLEPKLKEAGERWDWVVSQELVPAEGR